MEAILGYSAYPSVGHSYQRAKMLTHHALEMLKRRTGLTNTR